MSQTTTRNQRQTIQVIDSVSKVPFIVQGNSSTGSINVAITAGGGGTQYASDTTTPSPVIGNALIYDNSGTLQNVSVANPLPVSATISTGALATSANQSTEIASLSTIVTNTSGLATSTNQTNGTQQTQITDVNSVEAQNMSPGTPNSNGNAQLVGPTTQSQTFSVQAVQVGTVYDVGNYASVRVHVLTQYVGTTPTIGFQASNDGTNFVSKVLEASSSAQTIAVSSTTSSGVLYEGTLSGRYFRLNFTGAYSSGTATGVIVFSTAQYSPMTLGVNTILGSALTSATGSITTSSTSVVTASTSSLGSFALISIHGTHSGISFGITQSDDGGTTFYGVPIYDAAAQAWLSPGSTITPGTNASKNYWIPINPASSEIKVLASAFTSGSGSIRISGNYTAMPGSFMNQIMDAAGNARGANVTSGNALLVDSSAVTQPISGTVAITNPLVSTPLTGQSKIAVTATAVNLNGGTSQLLPNGIIISAPIGNSAPIAVGGSGVNNTAGGTGNGYQLAAGASVSFAVSNTNNVWINGTSGDYVSWAGS